MMTGRWARHALVAVSALFLVSAGLGCSGQQEKDDGKATEQQQSDQDEQDEKVVVLYEYRFNPSSLTIPKGTKVVFRNKDKEKHNVKIGALEIDENIPSGKTFEHTFETTGEFAVENRLSKESMKMTITVESK